MPPQRRSRNSLVDHVVHELRDLIATRPLAPGEFLPAQKVLAGQYGVGLSTVREAIQTLTALGLVESRPGKGTWVSADAPRGGMSPDLVRSRLGELNARQLYEARSVIEVGIIKYAAQKATAQDLRRIRAAMRKLEAAPDDATFVIVDMDYHIAVALAAHNELLAQFYHLAHELLMEVATELIALPNVKAESLPLQEAVARAIERHDVAKAEKAARAHMRYIEGLLNRYD
jgi:GntR family transcriptional regulator, transcriptional repressor for pyruvate dehydrogenase complex